METARELIATVDFEGRLISLNAAFEAMTGWNRALWIGRSFTEIVHPEDVSACMAIFEAARRGDVPPYVTHRLATRRGEWLTLESTGTPVYRDGRVAAVMGIGRDVTSRLQAEEGRRRAELELLRRERLFEDAEKAAHVGSWEWDMAGGTLVWSAETYRIFGLKQGRFVPTYARFLERVHPEDRGRVAGANARTVRHGGQFAFEFRIVRPSRELRFLLARGHVSVDRKGAVVRVVGNVQDVTERRRDEQLRRDLVTRLLAAHEEERARLSRELHDGAGQSLTAALVGLRRVEDAASLEAAKALAVRQRGLIATIIDELGRLARGLRPPALEELGLHGALERYAVEGGRLLGLDVRLQSGRIRGLPREVETAVYRTVQEAVSNAARHASAGGVWISLKRERATLRLDVTDDGCGFEVSRVRRGPGHLGLKGIRERAALLGGRAEIVSRRGQGTTVTVTVPLRVPAPARPPRRAATPSRSPLLQAARR